MSKLRLIIQTVNLSAVLRNSSEGKNIIKIETKNRVDVVNESFNILLRTLVELEGNSGKRRTAATTALVNPFKISTPIDPLPTPVRRPFRSLKVAPEVAIS